MKPKREQAWRTRHSQGKPGTQVEAQVHKVGVQPPLDFVSVMDALTPYFKKKIPGHDHWPPRTNYYEHYALWSALTKPNSYLEIGVLRGWSAMAVLLGWPRIKRIALIDNGMMGIPLEEAKNSILEFRKDQNMQQWDFGVWTYNGDSNKLDDIPFNGFYDLIHVDGEHSEKAVRHDLEICLPRLSETGLIIVDDQRGIPDVKAGTDAFLKDNSLLESVHVKTFTGHRLIWWSPLVRR